MPPARANNRVKEEESEAYVVDSRVIQMVMFWWHMHILIIPAPALALTPRTRIMKIDSLLPARSDDTMTYIPASSLKQKHK